MKRQCWSWRMRVLPRKWDFADGKSAPAHVEAVLPSDSYPFSSTRCAGRYAGITVAGAAYIPEARYALLLMLYPYALLCSSHPSPDICTVKARRRGKCPCASVVKPWSAIPGPVSEAAYCVRARASLEGSDARRYLRAGYRLPLWRGVNLLFTLKINSILCSRQNRQMGYAGEGEAVNA